jgi:hypothetical protein
MVATIATKKKERVQNKQPIKKENNIGKFFLTLLTHIVTIITIVFFGSNFSFAVDKYTTEEYLKTDPQKEPYKKNGSNTIHSSKKGVSWFYRKEETNSQDNDFINMLKSIRNWMSDVLIYSWSKSRHFIQETFSEIDMVRNSLKKRLANETKISRSLRYIIDASLVFLGHVGIIIGAFLFLIIGLILPIIGGIKSVVGTCKSKHKTGGGFHWYDIFLPWMWIIYGLKFILRMEDDFISDLSSRVNKNNVNNKPECVGFLTSIFLKILAFFTSMHVFTPILGPLQALYFIWKVAFTPIFNSPSGYYKGIVKKYKHILAVLFLASIMSSAWTSLNTMTATGITIGVVITAGGWIYSLYG